MNDSGCIKALKQQNIK